MCLGGIEKFLFLSVLCMYVIEKTIQCRRDYNSNAIAIKSLGLGALLGEKNGVNVGQDTTRGDGDAAEKLV